MGEGPATLPAGRLCAPRGAGMRVAGDLSSRRGSGAPRGRRPRRHAYPGRPSGGDISPPPCIWRRALLPDRFAGGNKVPVTVHLMRLKPLQGGESVILGTDGVGHDGDFRGLTSLDSCGMAVMAVPGISMTNSIAATKTSRTFASATTYSTTCRSIWRTRAVLGTERRAASTFLNREQNERTRPSTLTMQGMRREARRSQSPAVHGKTLPNPLPHPRQNSKRNHPPGCEKE